MTKVKLCSTSYTIQAEQVRRASRRILYLAKHDATGVDVVIKAESSESKNLAVRRELVAYDQLLGGTGIARIHGHGTYDDGKRFFIMERLGRSLGELFQCRGQCFSLKTVLLLADQALQRLEYVHLKGIVHRAVRPENFVMGVGPHSNTLYIIDFGCSKLFRDPHTQAHMPYNDDKRLIGALRYASINNHMGIENSRRDDLEALGYTLVYLLQGRLPWQDLPANTFDEKMKRILDCKTATSIASLCQNCPDAFQRYFKYCRGLAFDAVPDYMYLRGLFHSVAEAGGIVYDNHFDWTTPQTTEPTIMKASSSRAHRTM